MRKLAVVALLGVAACSSGRTVIRTVPSPSPVVDTTAQRDSEQCGHSSFQDGAPTPAACPDGAPSDDALHFFENADALTVELDHGASLRVVARALCEDAQHGIATNRATVEALYTVAAARNGWTFQNPKPSYYVERGLMGKDCSYADVPQ